MPRARTLAAAAGLTLAASAGLCAYASINARSQLFGRTLVAPPQADQILLTFDDGPNPAITPWLLDVLARHGIKATFFVIGRFVRMEPALVRRVAAAGHALGNHTMTHRYLTLLAERDLQAEISGCNAALEDALGAPVELFRPPHGARRPAVLRIARSLGLRTVQYNAIVGDWMPIAPELLTDRITRRVEQLRHRSTGVNLVLHDGGQDRLGLDRRSTVTAVDRLLPKLLATSRFVVPAECPPERHRAPSPLPARAAHPGAAPSAAPAP